VKKIIFGFICLALINCHNQKNVNTESLELNKVLNSAPIEYFNFDDYSIEIAYVDRFINFDSPDLTRSNIFIGNILDIKNTSQNFYIFSRNYPFIYQFDNDGNFIKNFGTQGRGPRDIGAIHKVAKNNSNIFLLDNKNSRIIVFDHIFNFKRTFSDRSLDFFIHSGDMIASEKKFLAQMYTGRKRLISFFDIHQNFKKTDSLLPPLIPFGMQPKIVNNYTAAIDKNSRLATSYFGIPYIFVYDSLQQLNYSIELNSKYLSENSVSLKPIQDSSVDFRIPKLISNLFWIKENYLLVVNRNVISIFETDNRTVSLKNRFKLEYSDSELALKHQEHGVSIRLMDNDDKYLYLASNFENGVFRIPLSKLGI